MPRVARVIRNFYRCADRAPSSLLPTVAGGQRHLARIQSRLRSTPAKGCTPTAGFTRSTGTSSGLMLHKRERNPEAVSGLSEYLFPRTAVTDGIFGQARHF